tara:strand:- start:1001 stop:1174 length:174 start_codon:yes stop_codon:yes gene_type:complete
MKITNLSPKISNQLKYETQNVKEIGQGITMRLLEKYKPKDHYKLKNISYRNDEKWVA